MREIGDDLLDSQRANDVNQGLKIFLTRESKHEDLRTFGFRHQPQTHFGDYSEVGLSENTVGVGTETVREELPGVGSRHCSHTSSHDFSIGQYNFKTAVHTEVVTVWGIPDPSVKSVSDNGPTAFN